MHFQINKFPVYEASFHHFKGSVQWKITYAFYCLNMFIWSYYAQNNILNNIIMMNFQDI